MRRAVIGLLAALFAGACGGGPTPEQLATKAALVDAHVARAAASHLASRYDEAAAVQPPAEEGTAPSWEAAAAYRASAEGLAAVTYLSELGKPVSVDPTFPRAGDIQAVRRATTELVTIVLQPAGTREEFAARVSDAQARLFSAVSALEKGTKNHILIETRSESNIRMAEYTEILAGSRAAGAGTAPGASPTP